MPHAAAIIRAGGLVAFPTETVYGLGANAFDAPAVARIFEAKGRPTFDPLIVHIADRADLTHLFTEAALADPRIKLLADAFWPGALTIVAAARPEVPGLVRAGLETVGVRLPRHETALALIRAAGTPIAAPSANRFGRLSPTTADHVLEQLDGRIDAVLLGEATEIGVESSVVALDSSGPVRLLRHGGIPLEELARVLADHGGIVAAAPTAQPGVPLQEFPAGVTACALLAPDRATLTHLEGLAVDAGATVHASVALSEALDPVTAAAHLFERLHELEAALIHRAVPAARIIAAPYPEGGLGSAIADRLRRAAATPQ
ncbi:MAG: threonylcarbamoyl-AMP synthase [Candidatus Aquidulcis sp.]|nr:MAG: threonylcarbamoyl-AMP synthase [Candidatus Aquidulcis sp.]